MPMSNDNHSGAFVDKLLVCTDCKQEFVFTVGEQEFFEQRDFKPPRRCKGCRARRKAEKDGAR